MDEETRSLVREALDLYKRELDLAETGRDRQIAALEAATKRARYTTLIYVAAIIAMGFILSIMTPLMNRLMDTGN